MTATVVIVDDELPARRRIRGLLRPFPDFRIAAECATGRAAVDAVREHRPDVLFLDVQMPGMTGFDVLRALGAEVVPITVFVTAFDDYAIQAFEAHAVDYLLKPFDDERFERTMDHIGHRLAESRAVRVQGRLRALMDELDRGAEGTIRFAVRKRDVITFVDASAVDWIESAGDYVRLHAGGTSHLVRGTMRELQERLSGHGFQRIHRSTIVRLDAIDRLIGRSHGEYEVVLMDGTGLRLSRTYREAARAALGLAD